MRIFKNNCKPCIMAALLLLASILLMASAAEAGKWKRKSKEHEEACQEWCDENSTTRGGKCWKCSKTAGCGPQMYTLKSWKGYGRNWYACGAGTKYQAASSERMAECRRWCNENSEERGGKCIKCSLKLNCGKGLSTLKQFRGRGRNWYACGKRMSYKEGTKQLMEQCNRWCDEKPRCVRCSRYATCNLGLETMKMFRGRGDNVHACGWKKYKSAASNRNQQACIDYCSARGWSCGCTTKKICDPFSRRVKSWTGRGKNWHACEVTRSRAQASRLNESDCRAWCERTPGCAKCSTLYHCGPGYKRMGRSWGARGKNWHACKQSGGSLDSP